MQDESAEVRVGGSIELREGRRVFASFPASFPEVRPFLKWTGGKQWLAPIAREIVPSEFRGTYHEYFLGGGALFFALRPAYARLSDVNEELIATYTAVRDRCDEVIDTLSRYPHDAEFFDTLRRRKTRKPSTTAARFIYLNKTAFNGIYRVNRKGEFNVPFGRYKNPTICQEDRLRTASDALRTASIAVTDFEPAMEAVAPGDFVYLDPPYITGHRNNGFVKYNSRLFSWSDQERLAAAAVRLSERGAWVLVSNADHPNHPLTLGCSPPSRRACRRPIRQEARILIRIGRVPRRVRASARRGDTVPPWPIPSVRRAADRSAARVRGR